ncbi:AAA family ATPase [Magnetovibrio sp. PR-2]|uniref:AAA family ATPase n=1 Tax=Magnetovibrio sp. PR-2 TaxID=3120356 RepID=UPI002FCE1586
MDTVLWGPEKIAKHVVSGLLKMPADVGVSLFIAMHSPAQRVFGQSAYTPSSLRIVVKNLEAKYKDVTELNPEDVRWYSLIAQAAEEGLIEVACRFLAAARSHQKYLPRAEKAYVAATIEEIWSCMAGTTDDDSIRKLSSTICLLRAKLDGTDNHENIRKAFDTDLSPEDVELINKSLKQLKKDEDEWGLSACGIDNLDDGLPEDARIFAGLQEIVFQECGLRIFYHLVGQTFRLHDLPAAHLLKRAVDACLEAEKPAMDTSTSYAYILETLGNKPAAQRAVPVTDVPADHVIVAPRLGQAATYGDRRLSIKNHEHLSKPLKLMPSAVSPDELRELLTKEFPWMSAPIDLICRDMGLRESYGQREFSLPPMLIWGRPGTGKTRFVQRLAKHIGLPSDMISLAGAADDRALRGTGAGYSTANPSYPTLKISETKCPNPVLIFDEVDKSKAGGWNGDPIQTLLMWTERENAKAFFDDCLLTSIKLSFVNFFATANEIKDLPMPFLSRFRVIETPAPEPEHVRAIIGGVRADFAEEVGVDPRFIPELEEAELMYLEDIFAKHANVRSVIRMTQKLLDRRERIQREMPH